MRYCLLCICAIFPEFSIHVQAKPTSQTSEADDQDDFAMSSGASDEPSHLLFFKSFPNCPSIISNGGLVCSTSELRVFLRTSNSNSTR